MFQNIKNDIMIFSCKLLKVLFVLYTALLSLSINANLPVKMNIDSLITVLDDCISQDKLIDYLKQKRIDEIKLRLKDSDINEEYAINNFLYEEYVYYKCDSALYYINRNIELAKKQNNKEKLIKQFINKAHLLASSGLYDEGLNILKSIDITQLTNQDSIRYYSAYENIYLYKAEYAFDDEYRPVYLNMRNKYSDSICHVSSVGSYDYIISKIVRLDNELEYDKAYSLISNFLRKAKIDSRKYGILHSYLAYISGQKGDNERRIYHLLESAIADIKNSVKENISLRTLSELLYQNGDIKRANIYMKKSIEDANFFNARLRNIQSSKMLPIIDSAYQMEREARISNLRVMLIIIGILSLLLIVAVILVIVKMKKLSKTRKEIIEKNDELRILNDNLIEYSEKQKEINALLEESNYIKEEYIGRFLSLCSAFIDKWEQYRKMLNKKAASGKINEIYKDLKSSDFIDDTLCEFYKEFDNAFLNIYPHFINEFNKLFINSETEEPRQGEKLSTGLRIFALIRLGIAGFLRCSITTVYTYRSKLKNKSFCKNTFEQEIMKIDSLKTRKD